MCVPHKLVPSSPWGTAPARSYTLPIPSYREVVNPFLPLRRIPGRSTNGKTHPGTAGGPHCYSTMSICFRSARLRLQGSGGEGPHVPLRPKPQNKHFWVCFSIGIVRFIFYLRFSVCLQHHSCLLNHLNRHHYTVLHSKNNAVRSRVASGADTVLLISS